MVTLSLTVNVPPNVVVFFPDTIKDLFNVVTPATVNVPPRSVGLSPVTFNESNNSVALVTFNVPPRSVGLSPETVNESNNSVALVTFNVPPRLVGLSPVTVNESNNSVAPVTPREPPIFVSFVIPTLCSVVKSLTTNVSANVTGLPTFNVPSISTSPSTSNLPNILVIDELLSPLLCPISIRESFSPSIVFIVLTFIPKNVGSEPVCKSLILKFSDPIDNTP